MKTSLFIFAMLISGLAFGQEYSNRVGINTDTPRLTLEIKGAPVKKLPIGTTQGVRFPNFSTEERSKFEGITEGTMIFNSELKCLEIYVNNTWKCINKN